MDSSNLDSEVAKLIILRKRTMLYVFSSMFASIFSTIFTELIIHYFIDGERQLNHHFSRFLELLPFFFILLIPFLAARGFALQLKIYKARFK